MRKKHPEHVNLERWLVSYADFITLLFAFFVVMYAISQADIAKFKKVSTGIKAAFSGGTVGMIDLGGKGGGQTANPFEQPEPPGGRIVDLPAGKTNTAAETDPQLQEVKELLEETVSLELGATDIDNKLDLQFDSRGLIVRLAVKDFFDPGQVEPHPDLVPILERIGRIVSKTKRLVRVEGHTDALETRGSRYASDFDLGAARAAWVVKYWMKRFNMDRTRLGIAGYSGRLLSTSADPISQAKNRRIEVIVLNNLYENP